MPELGRLEDLPADYRAALTRQNLVPLWPNLRAVLPPGKPRPKTRATHWSYETLRPLLLKAGELTPIEKAERRVLVLANPGHGLENLQASAAIYLGMQLLLPGEWAPAHRQTPNAVGAPEPSHLAEAFVQARRGRSCHPTSTWSYRSRREFDAFLRARLLQSAAVAASSVR